MNPNRSSNSYYEEDDNPENSATYRKIVSAFNEAAVCNSSSEKLDLLRKVQEMILNQEPQLLNTFLDDILNYQADFTADVRKFVVGFIEEACKKDPEILPHVAKRLEMLLQDESPQVQKRVIQAASSIYRGALVWLSHAQNIYPEMESAWSTLNTIKSHIFTLIDNDNDGIRTQSVKFMEGVVLLQTYADPNSMGRNDDFSLDDVPLTLKIARRRKLEEEANMVFELLVKFHGSPHISSVNLMACMQSLTVLAKMRPEFMGKVVAALETLHTNLPPTLTKSQVSSVRKHLKLQLLNLLKHPLALEYHTNITTLLTDLGATYQEVLKVLPKLDERTRRAHKRSVAADSNQSTSTKKSKTDIPEKTPFDPAKVSSMSVDALEKAVAERLNPELAVQLVLASMSNIPDSMPAHFAASYTPIAAAGTQGQVRHVARLLATQLTSQSAPPPTSVKPPSAKPPEAPKPFVPPPRKPNKLLTELEEEDEEKEKQPVAKAEVAKQKDEPMEVETPAQPEPEKPLPKPEPLKEPVPPTPLLMWPLKQKVKTLKLAEITKPLTVEVKGRMCMSALKRILGAEHAAVLGGVSPIRNKIITMLACSFSGDLRQGVLDFVVEDLRQRQDLDLALSWLYEEYSLSQGFTRFATLTKDEPPRGHNYNQVLCTLATHLAEKQDREQLLTRLFLEAPLITEEATELLKELSCDESRCGVGLALLQSLVTRRPPRQLSYLNALLVQTAHDSQEVRTQAMRCVLSLYDSRADLRSIIEEYAVLYLGFLRLPSPPDILFGAERGRPAKTDTWTESGTRACLYLYLELVPHEQRLIHELTRVYVQTVADVKRTILRLLETPVRGMGMDSPELLQLVEECPKGAETLVTRVIHILTDKVPPSAELVARVRDLYQSRVSDVRFLIPVLNGLTKREVIAALPRLIKLNPIVVKEVFNRLLGVHSEATNHSSPVTPAELLVALHNIDPTKCELKTIIKATALCFAEKQAYSQEVLAMVLQQLMEIHPLPTLLMRTVIQSLSLYPRLIGFVMNILQRLILKQVWKQRKVWEGFIKCCQRTKPQSFQVLLQLPPPQLQEVLDTCPDLLQPLQTHIASFTENQRSHIPQAIMDVVNGIRQSSAEEFDVKNEPMSPPELTIDMKEESQDGPVSMSEPLPPGMD